MKRYLATCAVGSRVVAAGKVAGAGSATEAMQRTKAEVAPGS